MPQTATRAPQDLIEDIYPLAPLQEGLLFHALYSRDLRFHFQQLRCTFRGELDHEALKQAWGHVLERHQPLRTAFVWENQEKPLQVVYRRVALPWDEVDLRGLRAEERAQRQEAFLAADRLRGFTLSKAPVLRLTLLRFDDCSQLVWSYHHLILDGWSIALVLDEVAAIYESLINGRGPQLRPSRPYGDFIAWLQRRDPARAEAIWRKELRGVTSPTRLGIERKSGVKQEHDDEQQDLLPQSCLAALQAFARQHQITLNTVVQGAWALLLGCYSGEGDVVFGSVTSGRPPALPGIETMVGLMVNTLPVRVRLAADERLLPWLQQLQAHQLELREYEYAPLAAIQTWSELPAGQALFDTLLVFENFPRGRPHSVNGAALEVVAIDSAESTNYPLTLLVRSGADLRMRLFYERDRFEPVAMQRLLGHYKALLGSVARAPGQRLGQVTPLSAAERQQLCCEWNNTAAPAEPAECLHRLFERQARRTPDAVAVVWRTQRLTYGELDCQANRLARRLRRLGVATEARVGILLDRSPEMVAGLLAVLKAGGAYVPLDPSYPAERLAWIAADCGLSVTLGTEHLQPLLPELPGRWLSLDGERAAILEESSEPLDEQEVATDPAQLAYVLYTSGSTGRPKGVAIPHRGAVQLVCWARAVFPPEDLAGVLASTSLGFDLSVFELFVPLCWGGKVVLADSALELPQLDTAGEITLINTVPSAMTVLASAELPPKVRTVNLAGEALRPELVGQVYQHSQVVRVMNLYGPSEDTTYSTFTAVGRDPGRVTIGRPLDNGRAYVLGRDGEPVPVGVPGELFLAGAGVARGYFDRPDLTAACFVPDPFAPTPGERLFRTGDRGRWLADGEIEFLGRFDHQVKLRGFRIELGEIEAGLGRHPGVRESAVVVHADAGGERRLVAYLAAASAPQPDAAELRDFLGRILPEYMLPSAFCWLDTLPLTCNGKVDRGALAARDLEREDAVRTAFLAPRTPLERKLAETWAELLGLERVGVNESFFELGGHSLLAIRLMFLMRRHFGVDLPLRAFFRAPTIAHLAVAVARQRAEEGIAGPRPASLPAIIPDPARRHEPFPLNDVQQAYWVGRSNAVELGGVATHSYNEFESVDLDLTRVIQALRRLIARHDMLRVVLLPDGYQKILAAPPPYRPPVIDLRGLPESARESQIAAIRDEMSHQVLDGERWPLFDIRFSLLDGERTRLHLSQDALIQDAWSSTRLNREFFLFYSDPDTALPQLEISFRDYVLAEVALQKVDLYRRSQEYWWRRLESLPRAPDLPLARDPSSLRQPRFSRCSAELDPERWRRLKARAARAGLSPTGVLLAAYAEILSLWSRSLRFTINLTVFNRLPLHPQVNDIIGNFTSVNLLEVDYSHREDSFELRGRRLQEQLWEDMDHRWMGGIRVLRELAKRQGGAPRAMMPVVLTSTLGQDTGLPDDLQGALQLELVYSITQTPQVWLDNQLGEHRGALMITWDAIRELFPDGMIDDMFGSYCTLVRRLSEEEEVWSRQGRPWLPAEHLRRIAESNATAAPLPEDELLHSALERHAAATPQAPAVLSSAGSLSYHQLAAWSAVLARRLCDLGAKPDEPIAIVMEKGWEQIVAALAVLRSGAPYLPIGADLPRQRIRQLLEQSGVELALTQPWLEGAVDWPGELRPLIVNEADLAGPPLPPPDRLQGPESLAYILFTSGSTGVPKGVMLEHRGPLNTVLDVNRRFQVGPGDRVLGVSSLSFDLSVYDVFGMLAAGGAIVLPEADATRNPARWAELIREHRVTIWNSVPALMEMLVEHATHHQAVDLSSLRLVLLSGDWIPVGLPDRVRELVPGAEVVGLGGPTEASIWQVVYLIGEVDPEWRSIPYGRPLANHRIYVLDELQELRPLWAVGELWIGGVGLARGYFRDAERTQASFLPVPAAGERLYRSGDLGRYLSDGGLEILGRADAQVKIRGHRIELGEIEAVMQRHPRVRAAAVKVVGGKRSDRMLVGYVVPEKEAATRTAAAARQAGGALRCEPSPETGGLPFVQLFDPEPTEAAFRRGVRFSAEPVPFAAFSSWLRCLMRLERDEFPLPKYRYPSAGNLYPVQTYLHVKPGRVEGIAGGTYYYDPQDHSLVAMGEGESIARAIDGTAEQALFEEAAFAVYLIAQLKAIVPLYPRLAREFSLLEAGYMSQLLIEVGAEQEIGLLPVGPIDCARYFAELRPLFRLDEGHVLMQAMVGGSRTSASGRRSETESAGNGAGAKGAPPVPPTSQGSVDSELARQASSWGEMGRLEFKLAEHGLRRGQGGRARVPFSEVEVDDALVATYRHRRSHREYLEQPPIQGGDLSALLAVLAALPEYRYPSLADRYPVETYLYVKAQRVEGVAEGFYRYEPRRHGLLLLSKSLGLERSDHAANNQELSDRSAFTIVLVANTKALWPAYGEWAKSICLLEAGHIGQLLMTVAPRCRIGLCPIGTLDIERLQSFGLLGGERVFVHALLGGRIAEEAAEHRQPAAAVQAERSGLEEDRRLIDGLRAFLSELLPDPMVPAQMLIVEELPLTANGKVDRAALPTPDGAQVVDVERFVRPRDQIEIRLVEMWEKVFDRRPIGVRDNFFELGGDSMHAVRLVSRIAKEFRQEVALGAFFREATIEGLAVLLRSLNRPSRSSLLVQLQAGSAGRVPLFCVHPGGGSVFRYHRLATLLGADQPVHGIQPPGLEDDQEPLTTVEDMVARYLEVVRQAQPRGPYALLGWSFGGLVAFEMARELAAQGEEIGLLAMLDTPQPGLTRDLDDVEYLVSWARAQGLSISAAKLREFAHRDQQLEHVLELLKQLAMIPPDVGIEQARRFLAVHQGHNRAMRRYAAKPYQGKVTLFRVAGADDPTLGWDRWVRQGVEVHEVPGEHDSMVLEPHVQALAERLSACLATASRERRA